MVQLTRNSANWNETHETHSTTSLRPPHLDHPQPRTCVRCDPPRAMPNNREREGERARTHTKMSNTGTTDDAPIRVAAIAAIAAAAAANPWTSIAQQTLVRRDVAAGNKPVLLTWIHRMPGYARPKPRWSTSRTPSLRAPLHIIAAPPKSKRWKDCSASSGE